MRSVRALPLVVLLLVGAGCVGTTSPPAASGPLFPLPCELAVDISDDRAFEPTAALDPTDSSRGVIVSTVFRDDDESGSPVRFKVHVTSDAGATFDTSDLFDLMPSTHPVRQYTLLADPMLLWLVDGSVLLFGMGSTGNPPEQPPGALAMTSFDLWMARSLDGGRSWPEGQVLAEGMGVMSAVSAGQYHDQPHVAQGPDGTLLLAWALVSTKPENGVTTTQDIIASRSHDGGRTWTAPALVKAGSYHNARPAIVADGTMYIAYRDIAADGPFLPILMSHSTDGGATWRDIDMHNVTSRPRPSLAASNDTLHLLVGEPNENGRARITVLSSTDGAARWSRTNLDDMEGSGDPLTAIATTHEGAVWATWHHVRADDTNEYFAWHRAANGTERTQRISTTPIGPNDPQCVIDWGSLGDYNGLSATQNGTLAAWISGERSGQDVRAAWLR